MASTKYHAARRPIVSVSLSIDVSAGPELEVSTDQLSSADNGDVIRNAQALLLEHVNAASGQLVVLADHSVKRDALIEQQAGGGAAPTLIPLAIPDWPGRFDAQLSQCLERTLGAVGGNGIGFAAADNGDVPATARNEMVDGHAN